MQSCNCQVHVGEGGSVEIGARSRKARENGNLTIVNQIAKARAKGRAREAKAMSSSPPSSELKMTLFTFFQFLHAVKPDYGKSKRINLPLHARKDCVSWHGSRRSGRPRNTRTKDACLKHFLPEESDFAASECFGIGDLFLFASPKGCCDLGLRNLGACTWS